MLQLIEIIS